MAFAETTNPDIANPFAATMAAPAELRKQIEAALARIKPKRAVLREPDLFWEEPGLHGSGRQVKLRSPRLTSSKVGRGRLPMSARSSALPPLPVHGLPAGSVALIATGAALAAGTLAWLLWRRRPAATAVGSCCGFDELGCD